MTQTLTPEQKEVLEKLPKTRKQIADELEISVRAVRYRMSAMERRGIEFEQTPDGRWWRNDENDGVERDVEPQRQNSYAKAQATKKTNNILTELEADVKEILRGVPVREADFEPSDEKSTLVIPRSDDHFGVKIDGRGVNEELSTPIAERRINHIVDHAIEKAAERGDVEEVILGLFGDHIDGEQVYPGHHVNLEQFLRGQIRKAATVYIEQIQKLSKHFDHVKIIMCPGNHGNLGKSAITNADDIVFDEIELGLDLIGVENVTIVQSNSKYVAFDIRGFQGYARHGDDALSHASTSSGDDRWLNWKEEVDFDVAYHGHYHQLRIEPVGYGQVCQCGTIIPPSLFVNSIGMTGKPRVFYHFATDEQVFTGMEVIEF